MSYSVTLSWQWACLILMISEHLARKWQVYIFKSFIWFWIGSKTCYFKSSDLPKWETDAHFIWLSHLVLLGMVSVVGARRGVGVGRFSLQQWRFILLPSLSSIYCLMHYCSCIQLGLTWNEVKWHDCMICDMRWHQRKWPWSNGISWLYLLQLCVCLFNDPPAQI